MNNGEVSSWFPLIMMLVLVMGLFGLSVYGYQSVVAFDTCNSLGYNQATDYQASFFYLDKVECGDWLVPDVIFVRVDNCGIIDKWGDCSSYEVLE